MKSKSVLSSSGNDTQVQSPVGNSWENFINYRFSSRNRSHAFAMLPQCSDHWATEVANKNKRDNSIPAGEPIVDEFLHS